MLSWHDRLRISVQPKLEICEHVQSPIAGAPFERRFGAVATLLDGRNVSAGQTRAQIIRSADAGTVFVGVPIADGRHLVGRTAVAARASLFQVFPKTHGKNGQRRLLCAHLVVHGYIVQVFRVAG